MTDSIADMLTRIRNAQAVSKETVSMPFSKVKLALAKILSEEGFLGSVKVNKVKDAEYNNTIEVELRYENNGSGVISNIERVSSPGQRIYAKHNELPKVMQGLGVSVVSTSQGLMTDYQARNRKLGGEIICKVW